MDGAMGTHMDGTRREANPPGGRNSQIKDCLEPLAGGNNERRVPPLPVDSRAGKRNGRSNSLIKVSSTLARNPRGVERATTRSYN